MGKAKERRVQALFGADEFELLADHAALTNKSISAVVREAVEEHLIAEITSIANPAEQPSCILLARRAWALPV